MNLRLDILYIYKYVSKAFDLPWLCTFPAGMAHSPWSSWVSFQLILPIMWLDVWLLWSWISKLLGFRFGFLTFISRIILSLWVAYICGIVFIFRFCQLSHCWKLKVCSSLEFIYSLAKLSCVYCQYRPLG